MIPHRTHGRAPRVYNTHLMMISREFRRLTTRKSFQNIHRRIFLTVATMYIPVAFVAFLLVNSPPATSWNPRGHKIIARIADGLINPFTAEFVDNLFERRGLGVENPWSSSLVDGSAWADQISYQHPWSTDLHFSHTPYRSCQPFDFERDCGVRKSGRCLVSAIANYTERAADSRLPRSERVEAIKFLVHLVADGHQGLHVGFANDSGGNGIRVTRPDGVKLHDVWDVYLIAALASGRYGEEFAVPWHDLADRLLHEVKSDDWDRFTLAAPDISNPLLFASGIASDTATTVTCAYAYQYAPGQWIPMRGHALSDEYFLTRTRVMLTQFKKAAVRLAQLLDAIAGVATGFEPPILDLPAISGAGEGVGPMSLVDSPDSDVTIDLTTGLRSPALHGFASRMPEHTV